MKRQTNYQIFLRKTLLNLKYLPLKVKREIKLNHANQWGNKIHSISREFWNNLIISLNRWTTLIWMQKLNIRGIWAIMKMTEVMDKLLQSLKLFLKFHLLCQTTISIFNIRKIVILSLLLRNHIHQNLLIKVELFKRIIR